MYKYTVTGLEEREASEGAMGGDQDQATTASPADPEQYKYSLKGIVVHSGTAFAGHYYSYIKVACLPTASSSSSKPPVKACLWRTLRFPGDDQRGFRA